MNTTWTRLIEGGSGIALLVMAVMLAAQTLA